MKKRKKTDAPCGEELLALIGKLGHPVRLDNILRACGLSRSAKKELQEALNTLAGQGALARLPGGVWIAAENLKPVTGRFQASLSGGGYLVPENGGTDIHIPAPATGGAWHRDIVAALLAPGGKREATIVKILERGVDELPCRVIERHGKTALCQPVDPHFHTRFSVRLDESGKVPKGQCPPLKAGMLVAIKPERELARNLWEGAISDIIGADDTEAAQETIVKLGHNVPAEFPQLALSQAAALPAQPAEAECASREDLRQLPFVTIDGADARDFDDAIHVEKQDNCWLLRVAIADVSHYVRPDATPGGLDCEALKRGNSWYFPRSVEPMLPRELSNGLCSLRPNEDRLAMLAEIPFSPTGEPGKPRFAAVCIRSAARLTYDQVADFFSCKGGIAIPGVAAMLNTAYELYRLLAQKRQERGTLDFDLPEPAYEFDEEGNLKAIGIVERNDAHRLIEEFMIAANEAVASWLGQSGTPFLYRVHPRPEAGKLAALFDTLKHTAIEKLPADRTRDGAPNPEAILEVLEKAKGTPEEYVVNRLCLRAMPQARYQPENVGHFGLASPAYCHFTSPIRRYADLLTHRALKSRLGLEKESAPLDREKLWHIGDQLNRLEREAMECEREMAKRLACLYLRGQEGQIFAGTVSSVTDFGIFVELAEMPVEGIIRLSDMDNDWYELDQKKQALIGTRTGMVWRLGQNLRVTISGVDSEKVEIRLLPANMPKAKSRPGKGKRGHTGHGERIAAKKAKPGSKGHPRKPGPRTKKTAKKRRPD